MNLYRKLILFLITQVGLFLAILSSFIYFYLYPSYLELEKELAKKSINQIQSLLSHEENHLHTFALDWALWDQMADYVNHPTSYFEEENFSPKAMDLYELDMVGVFNLDGQTIAFNQKTIDHAQNNVPQIIQNNVLDPKLIFLSKSRGISGIVWINSHPMFISLQTIYSSTRSTKPQGYLLMGRYLKSTQIAKIQQETGIRFELLNAEKSLPSYQKETLQTNQLIFLPNNNPHVLSIHYIINDVYDNPSLIIHAISEKTIYQKGEKSVKEFIIVAFSVGLIFTLFSMMFMHFVILNPIKILRDKMEWNIDHQSFEPIHKTNRFKDEFNELITQFNRLIEHVSLQNKSLEQLSLTDPLSTLQNRRALEQYIHTLSGILSRKKISLSIIMIDIDHFKLYNDYYGHPQGDHVIIQIAQAIRDNTNRTTDFIARYGGEEFILVLLDTPQEGAVLIAEQIQQSIKNECIPHQKSLTSKYVTISVGVASLIPTDLSDIYELIGHADEALYEAKSSGRNKIISYKNG